MTSSLESRIRRLEIRAELSDLVGRYGHLLDTRDWDAVAELYTRDGVLAFTGGSVAGREALRAFYAENVGAYELTFHFPHTQVLEFEDDGRVRGVITAHAEHGRDGACLLAGVRYHDEYAEEDGAWRLARREIVSRYFLRWGDLDRAYHEGAAPTPH